MKRYVGRMFDDREPEVITERFTGISRDAVEDKIEGVYRDFTDPDDGVRPLHLKYSITEEEAVSLLLNKEELQLVIDCLDGTHYCNGPKAGMTHRLMSEFKKKLEKDFK